MPASAPSSERPRRLPRLAAELLAALRFYTRVPLPVLALEVAHPPEPFGRALRWAPLAGIVIGCIGVAVLTVAEALDLPPLIAATLAFSATVLATGGLHEDGLADLADGFGGGATPERKLAIMRDSRLGTYGALALGLSLLLRISALTTLLERGGLELGAAGLVASAAASRGIGLLPLAVLQPARADGLARGAGLLPRSALTVAVVLAVAAGVSMPVLAGTGVGRPGLGLALSFLVALGISDLARRQIGGVTGDVAGAAQQLCEIAMLLGLLIGAGGG